MLCPRSLTHRFQALSAQLQPVDDSAWLLWLALIVALVVFVVLLAHLGCQQSTPLLLPTDVCQKLGEWVRRLLLASERAIQCLVFTVRTSFCAVAPTTSLRFTLTE
jgi:hypothetical protein